MWATVPTAVSFSNLAADAFARRSGRFVSSDGNAPAQRRQNLQSRPAGWRGAPAGRSVPVAPAWRGQTWHESLPGDLGRTEIETFIPVRPKSTGHLHGW